jgi:hypothetical protein
LELAGHAVFALRLSRCVLPFAGDTTVRGFGESDTEEGEGAVVGREKTERGRVVLAEPF